MPENLRIDRQAIITNSDDPTDASEPTANPDRFSGLPQVTTGIPVGGSWYPVFRPLASGEGGNPYRGDEGHGSDNPHAIFLPNQSGAVAPLRDDPGTTLPDFSDLMFDADPNTKGQQLPLYVSVVPDPVRSVIKSVRYQTIFNGKTTVYQAGTTLFVPDTSVLNGNVYSFGRDESRARVTFVLSYTNADSATYDTLYRYAISHDPSFNDFISLNNWNATSPSLNGSLVLENCTEPFYVTIVPWKAYNVAKANDVSLGVIQEYATIANVNPAR